MLWRGALDTGSARTTATRVAGTFALCWSTWLVMSAALADADAFRFVPTPQTPWLPLALIGALGAALLATGARAVSQILNQSNGLRRLTVHKISRVVGIVFLLALASGQLPAIFALPAGLGDTALGIEAIVVARRLRARGTTRSAPWFNIFGLVELAVVLGIAVAAAPNAVSLLVLSPWTEAVSPLPLILLPLTIVPLVAALHIAPLRTLQKTRRLPQTRKPQV